MALHKQENQSERDEVHVRRRAETVKYYELKITYSQIKMQAGLQSLQALDLGLSFLSFEYFLKCFCFVLFSKTG